MSDAARRPAEWPVTAGSGFGSAVENEVLRRRIAGEIRRQGRITFRRFMELALYDPEEGYYNTRPALGARGDYLTSPEIHPLFGALVARQLHEFWTLLGEPERFRVVEPGPGSGALARAVLTNAPLDLRPRLEYVFVEQSIARAAHQRATLGALSERCSWAPALGETDAVHAECILSNELVDSFPVHRVRAEDGRMAEIYVELAGGEFVDRRDELSTPRLGAYFERLGLMPGEGCEAEVNLDALDWMRTCGRSVERGFVLTLDYGYPAAQLYAPWRRQGTLLCFYQHTSGSDPYQHVGLQDMTAHVDFTSLARAGREAGLVPFGFTTQQRWLTALGVSEALTGGPGAAGLEEYLARRRAVEALLDAQGLGRVRVLAQAKGIAVSGLRAFADGDVGALE